MDTLIHDKKIYYLYLSTLISSGQYACDKTNLASCKWNIDWSKIFPPTLINKDCLVRINLVSKEIAAATLVYNSNIGTVRSTFSSVYQNTPNGTILGLLNVIDSPSSATSFHSLQCDTSQMLGVRIRVPNTLSQFTINFLDMTESSLLSANLTDYQIEMYFEIIDC